MLREMLVLSSAVNLPVIPVLDLIFDPWCIAEGYGGRSVCVCLLLHYLQYLVYASKVR